MFYDDCSFILQRQPGKLPPTLLPFPLSAVLLTAGPEAHGADMIVVLIRGTIYIFSPISPPDWKIQSGTPARLED